MRNVRKIGHIKNGELIVRRATSLDFESIDQLHSDLYKIHHIGAPEVFKNIDLIETRSCASSILETESMNYIVAEIDSRIVGYLMFSEKQVEETEILKPRKMFCVIDLIISSEYRRQEVGKMLLSKVEEEARAHSFDSVEVPVFSFNKEAMNFYKKNGYSEYVTRVRKPL